MEFLFFVLYHFLILFQIVYPSRQLQRNDISEEKRFHHEGPDTPAGVLHQVFLIVGVQNGPTCAINSQTLSPLRFIDAWRRQHSPRFSPAMRSSNPCGMR